MARFRGHKRRQRTHSLRRLGRGRFYRSSSTSSSSSSSSSSGSSRSRSRSRSRGRDRSRSRGWDRSRSRGRDRSRTRSRTRSRSRGGFRRRGVVSNFRPWRNTGWRQWDSRISRSRSRSHSRSPKRRCKKHNKPWRRHSRNSRRRWSRDRMPMLVVLSDSETSSHSDNDCNENETRRDACSSIENSCALAECPKPWTDFSNLDQCLLNKSTLCSLLKDTRPTEFNTRVYSYIKTGRNVFALAEKSKDKDDSLAFALPLFENIVNAIGHREAPRESPLALVIAPTSARASQIASHCKPFTDALRRDQVCLDGQGCEADQRCDLIKGCDLVVCTPGRLIEMMETMRDCPNFTLKTIKSVVVVDAEECCRMGLTQQVKIILDQLNSEKQVILTASTFAKSVSVLSDEILTNPLQAPGGFASLNDITERVTLFGDEESKLDTLLKMLKLTTNAKDDSSEESRLVLVNDDKSAWKLVKELGKHSVVSCVLDSCEDSSQINLDAVLRFKSGSCKIMVMPRLAILSDADTPIISHVINYQCPPDFGNYIKSCRLVSAPREDCPSRAVHTFITRDQGSLSGMLITGLLCSMSAVPGDLRQLYESYRESQME